MVSKLNKVDLINPSCSGGGFRYKTQELVEDLDRLLKYQKNYILVNLQANFIHVYIGEKGVGNVM